MRRARFVPTVAAAAAVAVSFPLVAVVGQQAPAAAAPSPGPDGATTTAADPSPAAAGQQVCAVNARGVVGLSGMVATASGFTMINDSQMTRSEMKIFNFDGSCKLKSSVPYPDNGAFDPEDLAMGPDGTLWVADTGDNPPTAGGSGGRRKTVALWSLAAGSGQKPVIHRLVYPDPPHDAEALLIAGDGTPIIITKEDEASKIGGAAGLYVPTAALQSNNATGVPMRRAGEVKLPATSTPNPLPLAVRQLITGAATSPDRTKVVLRTYADAFEWDVPDGDVVKAITTGKPRITPLPNESWGEAITYSTDGKYFLTVPDNESTTSQTAPVLRYTPVTATQADTTKTAGSDAKPAARSWRDKLTFQQLTYAVAGLGALGLLLVVIGVIGILRSRKQRRASAAKGVKSGKGGRTGRDDGTSDHDDGADPDGSDGPGGESAAGGAVYGASGGGAVYGASGGSVYGASGGAVYGAPGGGRAGEAAPAADESSQRRTGTVYGGKGGGGSGGATYRAGDAGGAERDGGSRGGADRRRAYPDDGDGHRGDRRRTDRGAGDRGAADRGRADRGRADRGRARPDDGGGYRDEPGGYRDEPGRYREEPGGYRDERAAGPRGGAGPDRTRRGGTPDGQSLGRGSGEPGFHHRDGLGGSDGGYSRDGYSSAPGGWR